MTLPYHLVHSPTDCFLILFCLVWFTVRIEYLLTFTYRVVTLSPLTVCIDGGEFLYTCLLFNLFYTSCHSVGIFTISFVSCELIIRSPFSIFFIIAFTVVWYIFSGRIFNSYRPLHTYLSIRWFRCIISCVDIYLFSR